MECDLQQCRGHLYIHHAVTETSTQRVVQKTRPWPLYVKIDLLKVLHPTRHKIGHFGDVLLSHALGIVLKKLNLTQQKQTQAQNSLS